MQIIFQDSSYHLMAFHQLSLLAFFALCVSVRGHGYLSTPVSRNAAGRNGAGYCSWSGSPFTCYGDYMSLGGTTGPDSTGCTSSGGKGGVTGGSLSFATGRIGRAPPRASFLNLRNPANKLVTKLVSKLSEMRELLLRRWSLLTQTPQWRSL